MTPSNVLRLLAALSLGLLVTACATTTVDLPPVADSATGKRLPGKIIWHDLLTNDPAASRRFYGELFGWEFEPVGLASGLRSDSAYTLIRHNGRHIGGMVDTKAVNGRDDISQWVILMSVENVDDASARFQAEGGSVLTPPTDVQRRGRIAVVTDAQGALLALLQTRDGDPVDQNAGYGDFLWDELWTSDLGAAIDFYTDAVGFDVEAWETDDDPASPANYRMLTAGGVPRAGVLLNPFEDTGPTWISYLRVQDPAAIAARVPELGGKVIVEAMPRPLGGEVAFIAGPSGAAIALQTWPVE